VLLARLALDRAFRGRGLGGVLLADAAVRVYDATRTVAARYVVVDAVHESAAGFYVHHGFEPLHDPLRLVRRVASIAVDVAPDGRMPG
jgi:GNAT superfamily N-acetyltransferase